MKHSYLCLLLCCLIFLPASLHGQVLDTLTYLSFNIRYANGDKGTIHRWENRRDSLARFVLSQHPQLCGMQEVLHSQLLDLQERLPQYGFVGVGRDDGKTKGEYSPIVYLKEKWEPLQSGTFWLSSTPDSIGSVGWDAALPRIATWALLKERKNGKQLMCINTHFDHIGHQARIQSGLLILQKAREIAGNLPLVLSGDFNVDATDEVYHSITHCPEYPILDSFAVGAEHKGCRHSFHNFGRTPLEKCEKIDFVFISPDIQVLSTMIPLEDREAPESIISDHNPVLVDLAY